MTGELLEKRNQRKFIPVLRRGDWQEAAPGWLAGKYYVDLRDGPRFEAQYDDVVSTLRGTRPKAPAVATAATTGRSAPVKQSLPVTAPAETVRIVGVIADEVTEPRNDGTPGSALYAVPFRLSRPVSSEWAQVFEHVWNHPPRWTTMHRPGIARVSRDRVVLDGTTIDEVQRYHRDTLLLCVEETNRIIAGHEEKVRREKEARAKFSEEHRKQVQDLADRIRFDE